MATRKITYAACTIFLLDNATPEETVLRFNETEESRLDLGMRKSPGRQNGRAEDRWNGLESEGEAW